MLEQTKQLDDMSRTTACNGTTGKEDCLAARRKIYAGGEGRTAPAFVGKQPPMGRKRGKASPDGLLPHLPEHRRWIKTSSGRTDGCAERAETALKGERPTRELVWWPRRRKCLGTAVVLEEGAVSATKTAFHTARGYLC